MKFFNFPNATNVTLGGYLSYRKRLDELEKQKQEQVNAIKQRGQTIPPAPATQAPDDSYEAYQRAEEARKEQEVEESPDRKFNETGPRYEAWKAEILQKYKKEQDDFKEFLDNNPEYLDTNKKIKELGPSPFTSVPKFIIEKTDFGENGTLNQPCQDFLKYQGYSQSEIAQETLVHFQAVEKMQEQVKQYESAMKDASQSDQKRFADLKNTLNQTALSQTKINGCLAWVGECLQAKSGIGATLSRLAHKLLEGLKTWLKPGKTFADAKKAYQDAQLPVERVAKEIEESSKPSPI